MTERLSSLSGKYFILKSALATGGAALSRGRIIAPVSEFMPIYLCEIIPADPKVLTIHAQTLLTIEHLIQANLYDDRELMLEDWRSMCVVIDQARRDMEAREKRRARQAKRKAEASQFIVADPINGDPLADASIAIIDQDDMLKLLDRLKGRATAEPPDEDPA